MTSMKMLVILTLFLINLPGLGSAVGVDSATCLHPLQVNTTIEYFYRYVEISEGVKQIKFEVKASNDVHIALFDSKGSSEHYEIVIGAGRNSHSAIRRCALCSNEADALTYGILSLFEFRRFWITFGCNGYIAIGRNNEALPFLDWTDPNPLDVKYMGYSTGWGSTGEFYFCKFGEKHELVRENVVLSLSCEPDSVIYTVDAFYGYDRTDCDTTSTVTEENTDEGQICSAENSKQIVSSACDHQQHCTVTASNEVFNNICRETQKFLRVSYICIGDLYLTSPSSSPSVPSTILTTSSTRDDTLGVKTNEKKDSNLQQIKHAEEEPAWPIIILCLVGFLLLLTGTILLAWKMIQKNRSGRGIIQMQRLV